MKKLLVVLLTLVLCLGVFVACGDKTPEVTYDVDAAASYLFNLYKDKAATTAADFDVTAKVQVSGVSYDVEWTATEGVTIVKKNDTTYTVDINEKTTEAYEYTLTATIKAGDGTTAQKTFKFNVPKYELMTWEQYIAAAAGDPITSVEGVVTGMVSKSAGSSYNCIFVQDATGGAYYVYGMAKDPITDLNIEIGMTVAASGTKDIYSGTHEIKDATVTIVSEEKTPVAPIDYTEIFTNASALTDAALVTKQSSLVTIKGVEISGQNLDQGYLFFKLAGKEAYLRISGSTLAFPSADKDAFIATHAEKKGWLADVTGIISIYNNAFYLVPVSTDAFNYLNKIEKTPEQMIDDELASLTIPTFISKDTTLELPLKGTTYTDVTYTWAVDKEGYTIDEEGKIALTVSSTPVELKFTVTATCGDKTGTKDITVKVALAKMSIKDAMELADGAEVVIVGVVTDIAEKDVWSEKYGNMSVTITDNTGSLYLFRIPVKVELGDVISVTGKMATYKENRQIAQGAAVEVLKVSTSAEATEMEDGTEVVLKGTVTNIAEKDAWSDKYGNMSVTITDAAGTFYLFRITTKVSVGDEIVAIGTIGSYKGAKQLAQKDSVTIIVKATPETPADIEVPTTSDAWDQSWLEEAFKDKKNVQLRSYWQAGASYGAGGFMMRYGEGGTAAVVDISGMKYIEFDVYISDVTLIAETEFSFELTSAGGSDAQESAKKFKGKDTGWVNGWNHVRWALTEFDAKNGEFDPTKWNFIRWYNDTNITVKEYLEIGIVNIKFTANESAAPETPVEPETPDTPATPAAGNKADFNTFYDGAPKTQYATHTTKAGWTVNNAQIVVGTDEADVANSSGGIFSFIGGAGTSAAVINGKTSAPGSIVSPKLNNGIKSLSFKFGHPFSEKNGVNITINIKKDGQVVATKNVVIAAADVAQKTAYTYTWTLDSAVEGEFTIEIVNNSPSQNTGNKDRLAIWDLTWENK